MDRIININNFVIGEIERTLNVKVIINIGYYGVEIKVLFPDDPKFYTITMSRELMTSENPDNRVDFISSLITKEWVRRIIKNENA